LAAESSKYGNACWQGSRGVRRLPPELIGDLSISIGGQVPDRIQDPEAGFDPDLLLPPKNSARWTAHSVRPGSGP